MKYFIKLFLFIALICGLTISSFAVEARKSKERRKKIEDIVRNYNKAGLDLSDPDVYSLILKDVSKIIELEPKGKADKRSSKNLIADIRKIVNKQFPTSARDILKEAEEEAKTKFKMASILDEVTVNFQKGDIQYKVKGIFYGFGGNSIQVDDKIIAIFDLLPEHRAKFDKRFCEKKKREYIDNKLQAYYSRKNNMTLETYKKYKGEQIKENEKKGYIYAWKQWRTPKNVIDITIHSMSGKKGKKKALKLAKANPNDGPDKKEGDKEEEEKKNGDKNGKKEEDDLEQKYAHLPAPERAKKIAEEKLIKIRGENTGVDADQGYKLAIWGMTHKDVNYLFPGRINAQSMAAVESFKFPTGPIKSVALHFYKGYFNKVVIVFRVITNEGAVELSNQLYEKYGETDEQKFRREEEEGDDDEKEEVKDEKEKKEEPKPEEVPQVSVYTWTGKATKAVATITLDAQKVNVTNFTLVKEEVLGLKEKIDARLKKEKEEAEKAKRKKLLDQLKKGVEF